MSDKFCGLYVTLERECSEEYIDIIRHLIGAIKGVIDVRAEVSTPEHWFAKCQANHDIKMKILTLLTTIEK